MTHTVHGRPVAPVLGALLLAVVSLAYAVREKQQAADSEPQPVGSRLLAEDIQETLKGAEIFALDTGALLAGTPHAPDRVTVRHASQIVTREDKPQSALSEKSDASIFVAAPAKYSKFSTTCGMST